MAPDPVERGEFYEDCRYHPMHCIQSSPPGDDQLIGISLIDGGIGSCSEEHCGVVRMTTEEAIDRKVNWQTFAEEHGLPNPYPREGWKPGDLRE
jgi:hypothetical protein